MVERSSTEMAQMINGGKVGMFLWGDPYNGVKPDVLKNYVVIDVPKASSGVGANYTPASCGTTPTSRATAPSSSTL